MSIFVQKLEISTIFTDFQNSSFLFFHYGSGVIPIRGPGPMAHPAAIPVQCRLIWQKQTKMAKQKISSPSYQLLYALIVWQYGLYRIFR